MKTKASPTREGVSNILPQNKEKLRTDPPLSEKDEVKKAENRTMKAAKKEKVIP